MLFLTRSVRRERRITLLSAVIAAVAAVTVITGCGGSGSASTSAGGSGGKSPAPLESIRIGVQPDFDYMLFPAAHELGLDHQQGLDFQVSYFDQVGPEVQAMARGSVDVVSSCHACDFAYYKSLPTLRDAFITDQFKGFIIVGRHGAPSYEQLVASGQSPDSARAAVYSYLKGKTFDIDKATFAALLDAMLEYAHLPPAAVKVHDYASDATAATAFLSGSGDFFMGALPQEAKLLLNFPDRVTNVGGSEIIGPAGLWYSTMATTQGWLDNHQQDSLKMLAISLRMAKILTANPEKVIPIIASTVNKHSGSNFTADQTAGELKDFIAFLTLENANGGVFNPGSNLYWQNSVKYYAAQNIASGVLPAGVDTSAVNVDEALFNKLLTDQKLVSWINSPIAA